MKTWERGDRVRLRIGVHKVVVVNAVVLFDVGEETVIVARRGKSDTVRRARRTELMDVPAPKPERPPTLTTSHRRGADPHSLWCTEGPNGLCAVQRQTSPPTRAEMAEGVFGLCGAWLTSRAKPQKAEPQCPTCRKRAGLVDTA